jgi:hypothetical protein
MDRDFRRSSSNIIAKVEETWDVQGRDEHCEVETGQTPNPSKDDDDDDDDDVPLKFEIAS